MSFSVRNDKAGNGLTVYTAVELLEEAPKLP